MAIGFTLVLLILFLLNLIIMLFSRLIAFKSKPSNQKVITEPIIVEPVIEETKAERSPLKIVAAISAAIDCY